MKTFALFLCIFICINLLGSDALLRPFMVDEGMSVQAAVKFLTKFQYAFYPELSPHFGSFEPGMSIGILSTWVGGLGWISGGNLFSARVFHILYFIILVFSIGGVCRHYFPQSKKIIFALVFTCAALSLKLIPTLTDNIVYGMGEYSGALFWLLSSILSISHPFIASFFLGLTVFHTKFIFFPFCMITFIFILIFHKPNIKQTFYYCALFALPLLAWMTLVWIRTGTEGLLLWLEGRGFHLSTAKTGTGAHLDPSYKKSTPSLNTLSFSRFYDHNLEWARYTLSMKLKILFLLISGFISSLISPFLIKKHFSNLNSHKIMSVVFFFYSLAALFLVFSMWYFFFHAQMWLRHILPTLLICFFSISFFIFFFFKKNIKSSIQNKLKVKWLGTVFCFLLSIVFLKDFNQSYRNIKNISLESLYSFKCSVDQSHSLIKKPLSHGPADEPLEKCGFNFPLDVNKGQELKFRY